VTEGGRDANVALVAPAGTVTLAGTVVEAELSESVTDAPPAAPRRSRHGARHELPPTTLVGLSDTAESVGPVPPQTGLAVSVALFVRSDRSPR